MLACLLPATSSAQPRGNLDASTLDPTNTVIAPGTSPAASPEQDSLFVPVIPGGTPRPVSTPRPASEIPVFVPSELPAPAIQSTPETVNIVDSTAPPIQMSPALPISQVAPTPPPPSIRTLPALPATDPVPFATPLPASTQATQPAPAKQQTTRPAPTRRSDPVNEAASGGSVSNMMSRARVNRDAKQATQVGWAQFQRKDYPSAAMWFEQAIAWDTDLGEAYYGLALTKFTQGDTSQAEAIAGYRLKSYPKMPTLMGDILVRRAMDDYEGRQYAKAIQSFNRASEFRKLGRNEQIIRGWSYYYAKDYPSAANQFERLYRAKPDKASAEGLYATLSRTKDWTRLELVAAEVPGPLSEIYMTYDTENYYKSGLFLAAYASNEKAYPALENINAPSLALGLEYAPKSGQNGESRLITSRAPVAVLKFYPVDQVEVTAKIARLVLNSGNLNVNANVGTPPDFEARIAANDAALAAGNPPVQIDEPYAFKPTTSYNDLYEGKVRIEYQDWFSPYAELGVTPVNALLSPRVIGKAGASYRHAQGYVQGEFYSTPIRESLLSYVGLRDPYQGREWGRVQETGGSLSVFQGFREDYTFFAKGSYGTITGTNTYKNNHLALFASLSRLLKYEGFEYITVGPSVSYERFDNNQNFFTYGHGGYFSPEYIVQGIIEAQFLTSEGLNWLARGSIGAGGQQNSQKGSPFFPLNPDGRDYPDNQSTTGIFLVKAEGGYLITPEFMIGAKLGYSVTADYNEGFATIYVKYFFENRAGLFRSDLDFSYW